MRADMLMMLSLLSVGLIATYILSRLRNVVEQLSLFQTASGKSRAVLILAGLEFVLLTVLISPWFLLPL